MNARNIIRLLKILGANNVEEGDEWVKASCPFAPYPNSGHKDGTDSRPSFGISIGNYSSYHCFACGAKGPLPVMITALEARSGKDLEKARSFVFDNEDIGLEDYDREDHEPREVLSVLPTVILHRYDKCSPNLAICRRRGITAEAIARFRLRWDESKRRLVLPVFDSANRLVGIRGRTSDESDRCKYLEYTELSPTRSSPKAHGIWFGEQFPPLSNKKLVLVEGELDCIRLWQVLKRPGIWASMGASISKEQIKRLKGIRGHSIVLFFDDDAAGHRAAETVIKNIKGVVPNIFKVKNYAGCKDPAEMCDKKVLRHAFEELENVG